MVKIFDYIYGWYSVTFMVGFYYIYGGCYIYHWLLLHLSVLQLMATKVRKSSSVRKYDKHHAGAVPEKMQVRTNWQFDCLVNEKLCINN